MGSGVRVRGPGMPAGDIMSAPSESCSPLSLLSVSGDLPTWGREPWYPQLLPTIPRGKRGGEKSRINKRIGRSTAAQRVRSE